MDLLDKIDLFVSEDLITEKFELFVDDDNTRWALDNPTDISKAQSQGHMLVAIGAVHKPRFISWEMVSLDNWDKDWVKDYKRKAGEVILRVVVKGGHAMPLVKLNINRGLIYFLTDRANDEDIVEFESKGTKLSYLRVVKSLA